MTTAKGFTPTHEQLDDGVVHICYEYANLMSAAHWDMNGCAPWRTHADDAFLLGCRKMADFFLYTSRSKLRNGNELPDILARDYIRGKPLEKRMAEGNGQTAGASFLRTQQVMGSSSLGAEAGKRVSHGVAKVQSRTSPQVQARFFGGNREVSAQAGLQRNQIIEISLTGVTSGPDEHATPVWVVR